jgi:hypothetical protein
MIRGRLAGLSPERSGADPLSTRQMALDDFFSKRDWVYALTTVLTVG